ncbi:MAG: DUF624 domain-containing protein [Oscillospiraceae bacterium]|nr:DUF624 domain-containing protein [Oscillospiraceae bacterium]
MKLNDPDGPVMVALGKLADLVFCNILFCLCSLPVFTIGAALTALFDCTLSITEDLEEQLIIKQFWNAFKRHFRKATVLWLICLAMILVLAGYSVAVNSLTGPLFQTYRVTFYILAFLFLAGFQYVFPLLSRYSMSVKATLKTAWLLSVAALPWTLLALAVTAAAVYISFFMSPRAVNIFFFLWAFVIIAVIAYLNSFFYRRAFRKLPKQSE